MTIKNLNSGSCDVDDSGDQGPQHKETYVEIQAAQETHDTQKISGAVSLRGESQDDSSGGGQLHASLHRQMTALRQWPRLSAIILEVVLPLLSLIILSVFFGYFLALLEAPAEIKKNNLVIAARESLILVSHLERIIARDSPLLCVELYFEERAGLLANISFEDHFVNELDEIYMVIYDEVGSEGILNYIAQSHDLTSSESTRKDIMDTLSKFDMSDITDIPGFLQSIADCGAQIDKVVMNHSSVVAVIANKTTDDISKSDVTFNWIKCPESLVIDPDTRDALEVFLKTFKISGAGVQMEAVLSRWLKDYGQLFEQYYSLYQNRNMTRLYAREKAITEALLHADGFDGCIKDSMSAAWFWFVVMTTIGYGNTSPSTFGGRALVFTFGFLCILLFGAVLARTGDVVTTIFYEATSRNERLKWLSARLWAEALFWCICTFLWCAVIAAVFVWWKKGRVDREESFSDGYWFAFISITTVGLGDFYLEHDAIAPHDVVGFAMLFLIGFALFANFLTCLKQLLSKIRTFVAHLRE